MLWKYAGAVCLAIALSLFALLASVAAADSITIDMGGTPVVLPINVANKAMLTRRCDKLAPGAPSVEECVKVLIVDMLKGYKTQTAGQDHVDACTTFKTLTGAQQNTIVGQLGGTSPCP